MAPPLVQLTDIALTFGGTPLLDGAELSVARGRAAVPRRPQRLGQIDAAQDRGRPVEPDRGTRFVQPGATDPLSAAGAGSRRLRHRRATMSRPGSAPATIRIAARYLLEQLGLTGDGRPGAAFRRRGAARRAGARARARARHPAARRADQPSRPAGHRMAGGRARRAARRRSCSSATTGASSPICRAPPSGSTAARRGASSAASPSSRRGATRCWREEERDRHKLDRKIVAEEHWLRYGVTARRKRNVRRVAGLQALRQDRREHAPRRRQRQHGRGRGRTVRHARRSRRRASRKSFGDAADRARFLDPHPARRPRRHRRPERRRQDDAAQSADRRARARQRQGEARRQPRRWRRSTSAARASIRTATLAEVLTGGRGDTVMVGGEAAPRHRLHEGLPVRAGAGAHAGRACSRAASAAG